MPQVLSPTVVIAWPWRKRLFNGYPRMREAGLVMLLVFLDDVPQILLVALSLSLSTSSAGAGAAADVGAVTVTDGASASGCDAATLSAGVSSTQLSSLAVAVLSLLWRGVSRLVLTLLGEDRTSSHILASRPAWAFAMPAVHLLSGSSDCDQLMRFMRSLARNGSALTHESRELEFALGFDPDSPAPTPRSYADSQRKLSDEVLYCGDRARGLLAS